MAGEIVELFPQKTYVFSGGSGASSDILASPVFLIADFNSISLRVRVHGMLANTQLSVHLQHAMDPAEHDWKAVGGAVTATGTGVSNALYTAQSNELATYCRARLQFSNTLGAQSDYGGTIQIAAVGRE